MCGLSSGVASAGGKYPAIPKGPIKLGVSLDLSGADAPYGLSGETAWKDSLGIFDKLYPSGIDGHKVVLDIVNDGSDATLGVSAAQQLASNKVAAVVAASYVPAANTIQFATWEKDKIPMLTNNIATAGYADTKYWPYFFSVAPSVEAFGVHIASWLESSGITKVGVLTDGASNTVATVNDMEKSAGSKIKIVKSVTVAPGAVDVTTQLQELKSANPQAVVVEINAGFGPVWEGFQSLGWSPTVVTGESAFFDGYTSLGTSLAPHAFTTCIAGLPAGQTLPASLAADLKILNAHGVPDQLIALQSNLNTFQILRAAIIKENSDAPAAVKAGIESLHDNTFLYKTFVYHFSATNHSGIAGPGICDLSPLGKLGIPIIAPPLH